MVNWSEPAKTDLRSIHDFIAHDSRHYAKKVTQDMLLVAIPNRYAQNSAIFPGFLTAMVFFRHPLLHE